MDLLNSALKDKNSQLEEYKRKEQEWSQASMLQYKNQTLKSQLEDSKKTIESLYAQIREKESRIS